MCKFSAYYKNMYFHLNGFTPSEIKEETDNKLEHALEFVSK